MLLPRPIVKRARNMCGVFLRSPRASPMYDDDAAAAAPKVGAGSMTRGGCNRVQNAPTDCRKERALLGQGRIRPMILKWQGQQRFFPPEFRGGRSYKTTGENEFLPNKDAGTLKM